MKAFMRGALLSMALVGAGVAGYQLLLDDNAKDRLKATWSRGVDLCDQLGDKIKENATAESAERRDSLEKNQRWVSDQWGAIGY